MIDKKYEINQNQLNSIKKYIAKLNDICNVDVEINLRGACNTIDDLSDTISDISHISIELYDIADNIEEAINMLSDFEQVISDIEK